jgi:amino acid transporter
MLVVTRIVLQFFLQHVGVMLLRAQRPDLERPFRIPLYPLPPLLAMTGFAFMLVDPRRGQSKGGGVWLGLAVAVGIAVSGTLIYLLRARRLAQWPFAKEERS